MFAIAKHLLNFCRQQRLEPRNSII